MYVLCVDTCMYIYICIFHSIPYGCYSMIGCCCCLLEPPQFVLWTSNQPTNLYWLLSYSHCCFSGFNHNLLMKIMFKMFMCTSFRSYFIPLYLPISPFNHYACFFHHDSQLMLGYILITYILIIFHYFPSIYHAFDPYEFC